MQVPVPDIMTPNVLFVLNHTQRIESPSLDTLLAKAHKDGLVPLKYTDEIVRIGRPMELGSSRQTVFSEEYKLPAAHLRMQENIEEKKPWLSCEYDAVILQSEGKFTLYFGYNLRYNIPSTS